MVSKLLAPEVRSLNLEAMLDRSRQCFAERVQIKVTKPRNKNYFVVPVFFNKQIVGPAFPAGISLHSMTTLPDQNGVLVIGGLLEDEPLSWSQTASNSIFEMVCTEEQCNPWTKKPATLKFPRYGHLSFFVYANFTCYLT